LEEDFTALLEVRLLSVGAIEPAVCSDFVSKSRLVPKRDGGFRLVVDLRHVNSHFPVASCKFETLGSLEHLVHPNDWFFSLDLKDGYYHLAVHPSHRKFLTTVINGTLYQFVGLPFGLQSAPLVFTKLMRVFVRALRARGLRVLPYLDDFLVVSGSERQAMTHRLAVQEVLTSLGLTRNPSKGQWSPAQSVVHLGVGIDSVSNLFFVPPDKLSMLRASARSLVSYTKSHRRWVHHQRLESFVGYAMSLVVALSQARTRCRSLYDALATRPSRTADCRLSSQQLSDLQWFIDIEPSFNGLPLIKPVSSVTVATDASDFGWGASISGVNPARGFFGVEDAGRHITFKELFAVLQALVWFPTELGGRSVSLLTDNQATMAVVNKGTSRSPLLMSLCRKIQALVHELRIFWRATYIRSADNVEADRLSRVTDPTDWTISEDLWSEAKSRFGLPEVDRFATNSNRLCCRYNSRDQDPLSEGNASLVPWAQDLSWINPPWALLSRVLAKVVREQAPSVLLLPFWKAAPWWPLVVHHSTILWEIPFLPRDCVVSTNPALAQPLKNPAWLLCLTRMF